MKKHIFTPFSKMTMVVLLFAMFGFQQMANAQLTVVNTLDCWVLVGEYQGANCTICNNPPGTWIAPQGQPGSTVVFPVTLACVTSALQQNWIGIKYASCTFPSLFPCGFLGLGPGSFSNNPSYPTGPCYLTANNSSCAGNQIIPQWLPAAPNGAVTVILQ